MSTRPFVPRIFQHSTFMKYVTFWLCPLFLFPCCLYVHVCFLASSSSYRPCFYNTNFIASRRFFHLFHSNRILAEYNIRRNCIIHFVIIYITATLIRLRHQFFNDDLYLSMIYLASFPLMHPYEWNEKLIERFNQNGWYSIFVFAITKIVQVFLLTFIDCVTITLTDWSYVHVKS